MTYQVAIGIFQAPGAAQDARNRLVHEGVAEQDVELRRLSKDTVLPPEEAPPAMLSFVDWVFGNDPSARYGSYVRSGEMALACGFATTMSLLRPSRRSATTSRSGPTV